MAKHETKRQPCLLDSLSGLRKKKCQTVEVLLLSNEEAEHEAESSLQLMAVLLAAGGVTALLLKEH